MSDLGTTAPFPERLGRYEVLLPIASGGMATVYLARSTGMAGFEREVAVKLTHAHLRDSPEFITALIDEARLAGRIRHPNVVSVLDVGDAPDGVFIVMEYVEGDSLAGIARTVRKAGIEIPFDVSLRILDDVLTGLHAAHELRDADGAPLRVVHRDVTPHNILVGADGVSRLTDFGVAKAASRLTKTTTGLVKGKISYMSPEQATGGELDRTCDVWAAGVVAWELLSGMRLYDGLNDAALMLKIAREPPTPLRHIRADVPRELAEVVQTALSMNPRARYPTTEAFAEAMSDAARRAQIVTADVRRVRSFIAPLVAPALEARKSRIARMRSTRRRVDAVSQALSPTRDSTPPSSSSHIPVPGATVAYGPQRLTPTPSSQLGSISAHMEPHEDATAATGFTSPDRPGTSVPALLTAPIRSRVWLLAALAPLAIVIGYVIIIAFTSKNSESDKARAAGSAQSAPLPTDSVLTPGQLDLEPPPSASVITPSELAVEPSGGVRSGRHPATRPVTPRVPGKPHEPGEPQPLANPYENQGAGK